MNLTYEYLEQNYNIVIEQREDKYESDLMAVLRGAAAIDEQKPMSDDDMFSKWLHDNCDRVSIDGPQLFVKARLESSSGAEYDVTDRAQVLGIADDYKVSIIYLDNSTKAMLYKKSSIVVNCLGGTLHQAVYGVIAQLGAEEHQYSS